MTNWRYKEHHTGEFEAGCFILVSVGFVLLVVCEFVRNGWEM